MKNSTVKIFPLHLEGKAVTCVFSQTQRTKGYVEFIDDTGQVFIKLTNGKNITLTAEQAFSAQNPRGG